MASFIPRKGPDDKWVWQAHPPTRVPRASENL